MSDTWIVVIPRDPRAHPSARQLSNAADLLATLDPEVGTSEVQDFGDRIEFVDAGENFESVRCPSCSADQTEAWSDWMGDDYSDDAGFALATIALPCCGASLTLDALSYHWEQGFARCLVRARVVNVAALGEEERRRVEAAMGMPIRVISQRY